MFRSSHNSLPENEKVTKGVTSYRRLKRRGVGAATASTATAVPLLPGLATNLLFGLVYEPSY